MRSRAPRTVVMWMPAAAQARYRRQMIGFYVSGAVQVALLGAVVGVSLGSYLTSDVEGATAPVVVAVALSFTAFAVALNGRQARGLVRGLRLLRADGRLVVKRARLEEARRIAAACPQDAPWAPHRAVGPGGARGEPLLWLGVLVLVVGLLGGVGAALWADGILVVLGIALAAAVVPFGVLLAAGPIAWHRAGPLPRATRDPA